MVMDIALRGCRRQIHSTYTLCRGGLYIHTGFQEPVRRH
ncbi:Uncharacterised protein [Escherichia coli]|nr:Uncharacterised protein [Escherichia coli]